MLETLTIDKQYCGPPTSGNGGFVGGLLCAALFKQAEDNAKANIEFTLKAPIPLEEALTLSCDTEQAKLGQNDTIFAEARVLENFDYELPSQLSEIAQAAVFQAAPEINDSNRANSCFTCSPARPQSDGLAVYAQKLTGRETEAIAATKWKAHPDYTSASTLPMSHLLAAMDCPGVAALRDFIGDANQTLLGRMTVKINRAMAMDEEVSIVGWHKGSSGRKHFAGTAMLDSQGDVIATAHQIWFSLDQA